MTQPTNKAKEIDTFLQNLGFNRVEAIKNEKCAFCGNSVDVNAFRDILSKKEYSISGLCQKCQDKVF